MCFSVWPYFLGRPTSGTETTEALTQILIFAVELSFSNHPLVEDLKSTISKIVSICRERYPANSLLIGLENEIGKIFAAAPADKLATELHKFFKNYLQWITAACKIISEKKWDEIIGVDDAIIVYSYSIPFIQSLDKIRNYHKGPVYIINCEPIRDKNQQEPDENEKMIKYLRQNAFNTYFLKLKSFGRLLETLELENRKVKIILGIFGLIVRENKKKLYMCQNGASLLARAAKSCPDAETYLIAESEKLRTEIEAEKVKTQTDLCFMNYCPQYEITYFGSRVDLVSEDLIKGIITDRDLI
jgi:hypothetical protein